MQGKIFKKIAELIDKDETVAMVTIVETRGSTPRKAGAKMLVTGKAKTYGTIGGGKLEAQIIQQALTCLKTSQPLFISFDFSNRDSNETDMLCGGKLTVFIEPVTGIERLIIFGAGHVGQAVYHFARYLDFYVIVADDRANFANKQRFPEADEIIVAPLETILKKINLDRNSYIVIATRAHAKDQRCLKHVLQFPAKYIGMLGSKTKWSQIKKNLIKQGVKESKLRKVHCPIGLDIGAVTPEEIGISIVAELIQTRYKASARK